MNEGEMTLDEALITLKELFPNLGDEIILSALIQNHNNYEATLDALLFFTSNDQKEKELSLFDYDNSNSSSNGNSNGNVDNKTFRTNSQFPESKTEARKENKPIENKNAPTQKKEEVVEKKSFGQKFKGIFYSN
jgi:hypothetical protein